MYTEIINIIITNIVDIIIAILGLVTLRYGVPAARTAAAWLRERYLYDVVKSVVFSIEQSYSANLLDKAVKKKDWAILTLKDMGIYVD